GTSRAPASRISWRMLAYDGVESGRQDEWFEPGLTVPAYTIDRTRHRAAPLPGPGFGLVPSPRLLHSHAHQARLATPPLTTRTPA
ncbi:hypothetical protein ABZS78_35435, partial [Streptomyces decoyicus]